MANVPADIEAVVVSVLSRILNRTEDSIRQDDGQFAAYEWQDEFQYLDAIDWATGDFSVEDDLASPLWGRTDFDVMGSIVHDEAVDPAVLPEGPLKSLARELGGHFPMPHIAELVSTGHIEITTPSFYGRIRSGTGLIEAATHLFGLHAAIQAVPDDEHLEIDPEWVEMLEGIGDPALRQHVSMFFLSAQAARSFGGRYEGATSSTWEGITQFEPIASWGFGEGQGAMCLARVLRPEPDPLPDLGEPAPRTKTEPEVMAFAELIEAASSGAQVDRLEALSALLDHIDRLDSDQRTRVFSILGNPWTNEPARAVEVLGKAVAPCTRFNPDFVYMIHMQRGFAADIAGDQRRSVEFYTHAIDVEPGALGGMLFYNRACEYGYLGMADEALADLERAFGYSSSWAKRAAKSDHIAKVRDDDRIQALLDEYLG